MKELAKYLLESAKAGNIDKAIAAKVVMALSKNEKGNEPSEYAIVGMNGEFAIGENLEEYRSILKNGIDCVRDFPIKRQKYAKKYLNYMREDSDIEFVKGGFLENIADFDYEFFGISPAEAKLMDPNQRRFLQAAWNCLEDAGYGAGQLNGKNVGVFVGYDNSYVNEYRKLVSDVAPESAALAMTGNIIPVIASRISYICDYHGPSSIFDTACSSFGVALYFACLAIESGECESAIVGSSRICMIPALIGTKVGVEAGNWKAKAFDDSADGTGVGEGVGAIYIKKLKDAIRDKDDIYCVIKGVYANCDGASNGITAPNPDAQAALISGNIKKSAIPADSISYFEAHGTGTKLGDPIEIEGISKALGAMTSKKQFCALGSSKTNLGHLDHASAMASIMKCALSLKHKELYPSLHFKLPNRLIDFSDTPVYLNTRYRFWDNKSDTPRRCAINAFGLSGTNANIILEEVVENIATQSDRVLPLTISAKSKKVLKERVREFIFYLENTEYSYADICYTASQNEGGYKYKCFVCASNKIEAIKLLSEYKQNDFQFVSGKCLDESSCTEYIGMLEELDIRIYAEDFFADRKSQFEFPVECHRVHLPVYPFQKIRCMLEIPDAEDAPTTGLKSGNKKTRSKKYKKAEIKGRIDGCNEELIQQIADIWCSVLGTDSVCMTDNFYELGGDSIFAMKFIAEIKECLKVNLSIKEALINPTFGDITRIVNSEYSQNTVESKDGFVLKNYGKIKCYEMTNSQKEMFVVQMMNPDSTAYNMFNAIKVKGNFDTKRFLECVNHIVSLQDAIRTNYEEIDGHYMAVVQDKRAVEVEHYQLNSAENTRTLEENIRKFIRPFDLQKDVLIRIGFVKDINATDDKELVILFDMHHIACDGISMGVLIGQICAEYFGNSSVNMELSYSDYAMSVNEYEQTDVYKKKENELVEKLEGVEILKLPTDFERSINKSFRGNKLSIDLTKEETLRIKQFVKVKNITAFQFFLAIFQVLLSKYSGQNDIVIGVPVSGRSDIRLQELVGLFINTVAVRKKIELNTSCIEHINEVAAEILDTYDKQCVSFPKLIERLGIQRDSMHNPLFDVMFSMQNFEHELISYDSVEFSSIPIANEVAKLDITMNISEHDEVFNLEIEYSTGLFMAETITRMLKNYQYMLVQCLNNPEIKLFDIGLSDDELVALSSVETNDIAYNKEDTIKNCFESAVSKYADKVALVIEGNIITYEELNGKANHLADILTKEKGLKVGDRVAILCKRSVEMIMAILAAVKAGVTYLPLDPDYPEDRLRYILKDSGTRCVIRYGAESIWANDDKLIDIQDILLSDIELEKQDNPIDSFGADTPMYTIYTSGSTGLPKGVTITQGNVRNFILGMNVSIPFRNEQKLISVTTIGFDIFVLESLLALSNGMEVFIATEENINDMDELCLSIITNHIDILQTTPSRIRAMMISDYFSKAADTLELILIGGEPFPRDFIDFFKSYKTRVFNVYGPTETTVWSTVGELSDSTYVHVGRPIANTKCIIVDAHKKRVPFGSVGELAIGGDGVAIGYHNRKELNAEKFVDLFNEMGEKFFLTGDLASWNQDGNLRIVGRNDRMVKLNGYRIELDEIQNAIAAVEGVKEASVFITGKDYLIACVSASAQIKAGDIHRQIKNKLPTYMIPNKIVILDELPHTPNGKLNNRQLRVMVDSGELFGNEKYNVEGTSESEHVRNAKRGRKRPTTELQIEILGLWQNLLGNSELGIEDDIFEYGANSLKVIEFLAFMKKKGIDIVINDVFSNPTVEMMENYLVSIKKIDLLKDASKINAKIKKQLALNVRSLKIEGESKIERIVIYAVENLDEQKKCDIIVLLTKEVDPECYVTHFVDMIQFDEKLKSMKDKNALTMEQVEELLDKKLCCEIDFVQELLEQCSVFEKQILEEDVEKEYRMAAIQHYFLDSERYSGTMIAFNNLLDVKLFNRAVTAFINEQGLFRADVVRRGNHLFWRQREETSELKVPFADLSGYTREVQFSVMNDICQKIYFKEYEKIKNLNDDNSEFEGLLYRMLLIKVAENEFYLILPVNHAIFDAMSGEVIKRRILDIYKNMYEGSEEVYTSQLSYENFVDQMRIGPINITEGELEDLFEMSRYSSAVDELEKAISKYSRENSTYIHFEIKDEIGKSDDNAWSIAFEALRLFAKDYLNIQDMPFLIYYYGRKYAGKEYFNTIGEFIDMIPMAASVYEKSSAIQVKTQDAIGYSEKYNVNFATLAQHHNKKCMEKLENKVDEINRKSSIVFNFQGKLEVAEMGAFESFLYNRLMHELNNEEARNIHVMTRYSDDKIQLDINLPFEIRDNCIKEFFMNTGLAITGYEQQIIVKNRQKKNP